MNIGMSPEGLLGIRELLTRTWAVYKRRMKPLILIALATVLLPALAFAPFFGLGFVVALSFPGLKAGITAGGILLGITAAIWVANWALSAFLVAVIDEQCGVKEAFMRGKPKILGHLWLATLTGIILTGAHLFFVIPGIILTVWFFAAPFVFMNEDVRGMDALLKSKAYVQGKWVAVAVRLLAVWFISLLLSTIPVVGQLAALFMVPFSVVYTFLLYKNLRDSGEITFQPSRREKMGVVATGALGYALPVVLVLAFMGSLMTMPFSMLTASVTGPAAHSPQKDKSAARAQIVQAQPPKKPVSTIEAPDSDTPNYARILTEPNRELTQRSQAAFKLGLSKDPQHAVSPLMKALETDQHWMVRKNAADALAKLNARNAVPLLVRVLETDENVFVREAAAKALGGLGDPTATGALKKALEDTGVVMTQKDGKMVEEKSVAQAARKALEQLDPSADTDTALARQDVATNEQKPEGETAVGNSEPKPVTNKLHRAPNPEQASRWKNRIKACTKAIKIQPEDALAYHHRAVAHFKLGNHDQALDDLTKALELTPTEAMIYYNRAIVYATMGKYDQAIEDGTKCIKLNPDFADAYLNRGIDHLAAGQIKAALADFEKLTELNGNDSAAYYGRGIAKWKLGSTDPAIEDFEKAADLGNEKAKKYLEIAHRSRSRG